jgi:hypothetical protein
MPTSSRQTADPRPARLSRWPATVENTMPALKNHGLWKSPLLLPGLLPLLDIYGAISTFRRVRSALWPADFPVYASAMLFPHPSTSRSASGFMLFTRCLPRRFRGLANISATLGNDCLLGFIITGLSPEKKRLALLGAQRSSGGTAAIGKRRRRNWKANGRLLTHVLLGFYSCDNLG